MQVHRDINHLPEFRNAVITIGTFDGVHLGHLQIINQLKKEALAIDGESVIITFHPHPRMVIRHEGKKDDNSVKLLNTLSEKIELLSRQGIDHLVVVPFTLEFSNQSAEEYISHFLVKNFQPKIIITGYDHKFGKDRKGDYKMLEKYQFDFGYEVKEIPEHILHNVTISSTKIRNALIHGDIHTANEYLGYDYFFEGKVIEGNKIGRTLGYPTANLFIEDAHKLIPAYGIYAVSVNLLKYLPDNPETTIEQQDLKGMMSIGIRPTIGDNKLMIEVNIFDFDKNIYGERLRIHTKEYLRSEIKFENLQELKLQIDRDKMETQKIFNLQ
jgi:riboflavin kinase/FMN adenylyltransferase